ncbi:MAG: TrkH family potassium uptake protein [Firmicutes bacterium]|nr:TrkH family potassium uptake protein [Bacillota bacterium]
MTLQNSRPKIPRRKITEIERRFKTPMKPAQILVLSFAGVILMGAFLLMLPISTIDGISTPFVDALFTSTSAVCVTGLVVVDTGTYWSTFGKTVIMMLIQIGGLGFMTMTTSVAIIMGKKIGLKNRMLMQEALNQFSIAGVIRLTKYVLMATILIESIGAILLSIRFIPEFGWLKGIYYSIFHAVSAFCNAGFDLMGNYQSLVPFVHDPIVNFTVMMLIIFGGLGFAVIADISQIKPFRKWTLHAKLVIVMTSILLVVGFFGILILEYDNPSTIGNYSVGQKIMSAMFHSVTPRTAGFNTLDIASLSMPTRLLTMVLMFIGGSPGSTAGGIKTTTFGIMILSMIATFKGTDDINFRHRRIAKDSVNKALAVIFISMFLIVFITFLLTVFESDKSMEAVMFEAISAFGTVGLSMGITPFLSVVGRLLIILLMFFGRLGPLTIVIAISRNASQNRTLLRYPEGKIIIG